MKRLESAACKQPPPRGYSPGLGLDTACTSFHGHAVRLAAGSWIELEDGQLEVVGPGPAGGLYTSYVVRDAGLLAAAVLPDEQHPYEVRAEATLLLSSVRPTSAGRLGHIRAARLRHSATRVERVGYRDPASRIEGAETCILLSWERTMLLWRALARGERRAWPPDVVARMGADLARGMLDGRCRRLDPWCVGLDSRNAWLLDPDLDALRRPDHLSERVIKGIRPWDAYLAPEQLHARHDASVGPPDAAARHGLGVILYELLAGRAPYARENDWETIVAIRNGLPTPLTTTVAALPLDLAACVHALLDQDALRRPDPATVRALLEPYASADLSWCGPLFERHARPCDVLF